MSDGQLQYLTCSQSDSQNSSVISVEPRETRMMEVMVTTGAVRRAKVWYTRV